MVGGGEGRERGRGPIRVEVDYVFFQKYVVPITNRMVYSSTSMVFFYTFIDCHCMYCYYTVYYYNLYQRKGPKGCSVKTH